MHIGACFIFFYDYYEITYRLSGTRYLILPCQTSQIGIPAHLGTFSNCPIVLYHGQAGIESALLSVGWSCRLSFMVAMVCHTCGAHFASCSSSSLFSFFLSFYIQLMWPVDCFSKVRLPCTEATRPWADICVRHDRSLMILDIAAHFELCFTTHSRHENLISPTLSSSKSDLEKLHPFSSSVRHCATFAHRLQRFPRHLSLIRSTAQI